MCELCRAAIGAICRVWRETIVRGGSLPSCTLSLIVGKVSAYLPALDGAEVAARMLAADVRVRADGDDDEAEGGGG